MGREVRCPDRMPGTRLGPENPNEESHETDRAGAGAQHDATPGNQGGGGCGALVRADKAQASLAKGASEKRQGRAATGQSKIVADVCVGGVNPQRRSGCRLSRIENSEGRQGAKPGPGREKGGARQAREDRVGKPAHTRSVRCRKSCDAPVGEQTQQAGRGSGSTHESGDGARTEGLVIAATTTEWCQPGGGEGGQTNRLDALVRRCRACRSSG